MGHGHSNHLSRTPPVQAAKRLTLGCSSISSCRRTTSGSCTPTSSGRRPFGEPANELEGRLPARARRRALEMHEGRACMVYRKPPVLTRRVINPC